MVASASPSQPKKFGDILVESRLLTQKQLEQALDLQKKTGLRLGQVLVAQGWVTDLDVAGAIAQQLGLPFVPDHELKPRADAARLIPETMARRLLVLPLQQQEGELLLAMVDPFNVFAMDEVRNMTGLAVQPAVVTERGLVRAIQQVYRLQSLSGKAAVPHRAEAPEVALADAGGGAEDAPVVGLVNTIIDRAIDERASDIHIEPTEHELRVRFRVDGVLREALTAPKSAQGPVVSRIKIMARLDISERRIPQDGRFQVRDSKRDIDLRVSTLPTIHGEKAVIRLLNKRHGITGLEHLGFSVETLSRYLQVIQAPHGMILVTGPTGSGKTTTLMATLQHLNTPEKNIITIEDPVEYHLPGVNHVQVNPKAGLDFASGLRSILRQDPNIIMVGEIRDGETADIAVKSALTGHLVLSTLHTNSAAGALTRLIDMDIEPYLIASSVVAVMAQRLARALCIRCKEPYTLGEKAPERTLLALPARPIHLFRAVGCNACHNTGYQGRVGLHELLVITPELRQLVTEKRPTNELEAAALATGMKRLVSDGVEKAMAGETTLEEVLRVAYLD